MALKSLDPLIWWKKNAVKYPVLAVSVGRRFLCIQVSSAASERVVSTVTKMVSAQRASVTAQHVSEAVFIKHAMPLLRDAVDSVIQVYSRTRL